MQGSVELKCACNTRYTSPTLSKPTYGSYQRSFIHPTTPIGITTQDTTDVVFLKGPAPLPLVHLTLFREKSLSPGYLNHYIN